MASECIPGGPHVLYVHDELPSVRSVVQGGCALLASRELRSLGLGVPKRRGREYSLRARAPGERLTVPAFKGANAARAFNPKLMTFWRQSRAEEASGADDIIGLCSVATLHGRGGQKRCRRIGIRRLRKALLASVSRLLGVRLAFIFQNGVALSCTPRFLS